MKKLPLFLFFIFFNYCGYSQGFFATGGWTNSPKGTGATATFGWGENFDRTIDVRPNPHPTYGTMMINYHTGLTFSAHSYYGGIRFYNQGYPDAYDPASGATMVMSINDGNVGINTTDTKGYKFAVNGSAIATSVTVKLNSNWPDYVFKPHYVLPPLSSVSAYIKEHQHLPEIPPEKEVMEKGLDLGEMNKLLVKKVEELTLYAIDQQQQIEVLRQQQEKDKQQEVRIVVLEAALAKLANK